MPLQPFDKLLALADAIAAEINNEIATLPCEAYWQDNPIAELSDDALDTLTVWVVDFAEVSETRYSAPFNGSSIDEDEILLVIQRRVLKSDATDLSEDAKRTECRALANFTNALTRHFRKKTLDIETETKVYGAVCFKTERTRSRDFGEYSQKGIFRAEVSLHWRMSGD